MTVKRMLSFIIHMAISLTMVLLLVYFIMKYTDHFFYIGRDFTGGLAAELSDNPVTLYIAQGSTIADIANLLEEERIIGSALLFRLESILKGNRQIFDENRVTVSADMSYNQLIFAFLDRHVIAENIVVTIPEGSTVNDIAAYLEYRGIVSAEEFIRASNESTFNFSFLNNLPDVSERYNRLEGYLFPDTYFIPENASAEAIINQMLSRFQEIYSIYADEAYEKGLTMDEVVIIASIIEREIRVPQERELASQVIHNRLAIGQRLQMCSTVLYALGENRRRLLYVDLLTVSYYNTYMHSGLPIGPIANPGAACIRAALRPSEGDLLFFVLRDENTGEHYFATNYADFLAARARYLD